MRSIKNKLNKISLLLGFMIALVQLPAQTGNSTFYCCTIPNINSIATFTTSSPVYNGNQATINFTFATLVGTNCASPALNSATFSFGDQTGNFSTNATSNSLSNGFNTTTFTTSHTYTLPNTCAPAIYNINIDTEPEGGGLLCNKTYTIGIAHPSTTFSLSTSNTNCNSVTFSYTSPWPLFNAQWIYGNNVASSIMSTGAGTTYAYPAAGVYTAYLTGEGIAPCSVTTQVVVQGPLSDFNYTVLNSCTSPASVVISIVNYSATGVTYSLQINGGTPFTAAQNGTYTSGLIGGANLINLIVAAGSCSSTFGKIINIGSPSNYAINVGTPNCKTFNISYSGSPALTNLQWSFGDGTYSQVYPTGGSSTVHTYPAAGVYVISLSGVGIDPCEMTTTVNVTDFTTPDYSYTLNSLCSPSAGVILSIANYTNYNYLWQINSLYVTCTGANATYYSGLQNGNNIIKLIVTDPNSNCSTSIIKNVTIGTPLATFSQYTNDVCIGDPLSVYNVTGGAGAYSWTITNANGNQIQSGMNPIYSFSATGVHTIALTITSTLSSNGQTAVCTSSFASQVTVHSMPNATYSISPVSCNNAVTLTVNGSPGAFTSYQLSYGDGTNFSGGSSIPGGQLSHTYASSPSNTVYVTSLILINAACQHSYTESVLINNNTSLIVTSGEDNFCSGNGTAISTLVNSNLAGVGPFSYTWTGPNSFSSSSSAITAMIGGVYQVTVASTGSCALTLVGSKSVTEVSVPSATVLNISHITCTNTTGTATISITNNTVQTGFVINGQNATSPGSGATFNYTLTGLVAGNNNISISNSLNPSCASNLQIQVTQTEPSVNLTVTQPTNCVPGLGSALMAATPSGGTGNWFTVANYPTGTSTTGLSVSNLAAGSYVLKYVDNNCEVITNFNIALPGISISKSGAAATCSNGVSAVSITPQFIPNTLSGTFTYTLLSTSGSTTGSSNQYSLSPGNYTVKAASNGCESNLTFNIGILEPLNVILNTQNPTCKDPGSVQAICSGGDGNYTYIWFWAAVQNTNTTNYQSLSTLTAQTTISVNVADGSGCQAIANSQSVTVTLPSTVSLLNCGGIGNGNATTITPCYISTCLQGGTPNYLYEWYNVSPTQNIEQWTFCYVNGTFVATAGTSTVVVPIPTSSTSLNLALNSDYSITTVAYPYWNFTVSPFVPLMNPLGIGTGSSSSTNSNHYYTVNEVVSVPSGSAFVSSYSGPSAQQGSVENFTDGEYRLDVTDAMGCKYTFSIGTLDFQEQTTFSVTFTYVWGMDRIPKPAPDIDYDLHEDMMDAADELLEESSQCAVKKTKQLKSYLQQDCSNLSNLKDQLTVSYILNDHHYTLYYYDRAGRLTKTVPPQGVHLLPAGDIATIKTNRKSASPGSWPAITHSMATTYQYNALNQLISQRTPDGGATNFIYDSKNRLRFSQNDKQAILSPAVYSYTKYDSLGRIIEIGESPLTGPVFSTPTSTVNLAFSDLISFPQYTASPNLNRQITRTVYSDLAGVNYYGQAQRFTQNRVSYTYSDEDPTVSGDENYSYYSYDSHGNVEWLMQEQPGGLGANYTGYEYDLVSGKVLKVKFNEKRSDRFFHRYKYDAENRLVQVETSRNGEIWDRDANYDYYAHGPLKRSVLGEDKVQGTDYIYTIQGWIKSINSPNLSTASDPGNDNNTSSPGLPQSRVAADRFGMVLNYFNGDYKSANANMLITNSQYSLSAFSSTSGAAPSLYNGNISGWIQSQLNSTASNTIDARADLFQYDLLNRIKQSTSVKEDAANSTWVNLSGGANVYKTEYVYDRNGNILSLKRQDDAGAAMDELQYTYDNGAMGVAKNSNRLMSVGDVITTTVNGRQDLHGTHQYTYDAIGNLTRETGQELLTVGTATAPSLRSFTTTITWNVYGKIKEINKSIQGSSSIFMERLNFSYDAAGNRVLKDYWKDSYSAPDFSVQPTERVTTFYVRDAQGNTMATYQRYYDINQSLFKIDLIEQPIYGSDRMGQNVEKVTMASAANFANLSMPTNGMGVISEYQNWITTTSKTSLLPTTGAGNNDNLCQCKVLSMSNSGSNPNYNNVQKAVEFLGIAHNGVAVAEDLNRNLQFYVVLAKNYLGNKNACLVFDKNGLLMAGSETISAVDVDSKPIIVNIPNSNKYAVVTLSATTKQAMYHVVDMSLLGYGPVVNSGSVISANNLLEAGMGSSENHGFHLTGIEDHVNGHSFVYATKYKVDQNDAMKGTTHLMAYDFGSSTLTPVATTLSSIYGCGNTEKGQLQVSPDGGKLGWWRYDQFIGGFAHRLAEVRTYPLNATRNGLGGPVAVKAISSAGSFGNGMLEFMKNSKDFLYSQRGVYAEGTPTITQQDRNVWRYDPVNLALTRINPHPTNPLLTWLYGEMKRGIDGNYYMPNMSRAMNQIHSYDGTNWGTYTYPIDTMYKLSSSLPTQVYKVFDNSLTQKDFIRSVGNKEYELKDHLGNVRVVISDAKQIEDMDLSWTVSSSDQFKPEVRNYTDYYAFGSPMPGRQFNNGSYRYGFNGKENDNEVKGTGNQQDYGMRIYDPRLGKFLSVDPITDKYPELTPYQFASNSPIWGIDWDGLELRIYTSTQGLTGHTFLSVGKGKDMVVYSYGQYGKPKYSLFGGYSPKGEGVLYRMTGKRARNFVKQYVKHEGAKAYEIKDADETKVKESMDAKFFVDGKAATEGKAKGDKDAKVINNDYDLFDNNCATNACEAAKDGGSNLDFENKGSMDLPSSSVPGIPGKSYPTSNPVNTPGEMETYLKTEASQNDSKVKDVTADTGQEVENAPH